MIYSINLIISFILELAMLAAFARLGFRVGDATWLQYGLAIVLPLAVLVFWATKMAPRARRRFSFPLILIPTLMLFELGALSLYLSGMAKWAVVFALVALLNIGIRFVFRDNEKQLLQNKK